MLDSEHRNQVIRRIVEAVAVLVMDMMLRRNWFSMLK